MNKKSKFSTLIIINFGKFLNSRHFKVGKLPKIQRVLAKYALDLIAQGQKSKQNLSFVFKTFSVFK